MNAKHVSLVLMALAVVPVQAMSRSHTGGTEPEVPPRNYRLEWEDRFEGSRLDTRKWSAWERPVEDAVMTSRAIVVNDGLTIKTTTGSDGKHYTGFLSSQGKFEGGHGYYEAAIRFKGAPGTWCAFWMDSTTITPAQDGAVGEELDIVEMRGHPYGRRDGNSGTFNVHKWTWDGSNQGHAAVGTQNFSPEAGRPTLEEGFHTYGVLWTPESYTFYLDGKARWSTREYASNDRKYLLLTCEVLDHAWAGDIPSGGYSDSATRPIGMEVEWVKAWKAPAL
jgi:beta-glucanase (GH16 family)